MTSCVRIISTSSVDSSPSILVISNDNSKILFNCGEGCQRTFVEYSQRLSTISTICVCSLHHSMIGGLPGTILTNANTAASTIENSNNNDIDFKNNTSAMNVQYTRENKNDIDHEGHPPQLQIIGPIGVQEYIHSLRHFMQRRNYYCQIDEVHPLNHHIHLQPQAIHPISKSQQVIFPPIDQKRHNDQHQQIYMTSDKNSKKKNKSTNSGSNQPNLRFTIQSLAFYDDDFDDPTQKSRKRSHDSTTMAMLNDEDTTTTTSIAVTIDKSTNSNTSIVNTDNAAATSMHRHLCVSYILTTPPIPGKFLTDKAIALGIPKGPLYGQLKLGQDISYMDPATNEMKYVSSKDVVEPSSPPISILILYYPSLFVAHQLFQSKQIQQSQHQERKASDDDKIIEDNNYDESISGTEGRIDPVLVVHITTINLFQQYGIRHWNINNSQQANVVENGNNNDIASHKIDHIFLPIYTNDIAQKYSNQSPFSAAFEGAYTRSLICPDIYYNPKQECKPQARQQLVTPTISSSESELYTTNYRLGHARMEYTILPRSKLGFTPLDGLHDVESASIMINDNATAQNVPANKRDAIQLSKQIINDHDVFNNESNRRPDTPKLSSNGALIFTGTASAIPCKNRNVTGMLLKQADGRSILLDVGEGTIGQLCRMRSCPEEVYNEIKAVWISHPHADHHLGLIRLLQDRNSNDKLLLIAPQPIFRFLHELEELHREIQGSYIPVDCMDLVEETSDFWKHQQVIQHVLGISKCRAVPVAHCAYSYAVILNGTSFGTVVYSGDCRPSKQLAFVAKGADLLIHEATFENGMEADAVLKNHSTIDEALLVGQQMECKVIVLTHFSQRYSKIPPSPSKKDDEYPFPIIFAYDFMVLQPQTLLLSSKLTSALRLLFVDENDCDNSDTASIPTDVLSRPGAFADTRLL